MSDFIQVLHENRFRVLLIWIQRSKKVLRKSRQYPITCQLISYHMSTITVYDVILQEGRFVSIIKEMQ